MILRAARSALFLGCASIAFAALAVTAPVACEAAAAGSAEADDTGERGPNIIVTGTVPEPPNIQQFLDEDGNEGTNGLLRLDCGDAQVRLLWLDEVERVVRVGTF